MVKLRMKRFGRRNRPFFRICAMDTRTARDSRAIEELGYYDPIQKDPAKALTLQVERIQYWLSVGAQASDTVRGLLKTVGIEARNPRGKRVWTEAKAPAAKAVEAPAPEAPAAPAQG